MAFQPLDCRSCALSVHSTLSSTPPTLGSVSADDGRQPEALGLLSQLLDASFLNGAGLDQSIWTELDKLISPSLIDQAPGRPTYLNLHQTPILHSDEGIEALDDGSICLSFPLDLGSELSQCESSAVEQIRVVPHAVELVEVAIDRSPRPVSSVTMGGQSAARLETREIARKQAHMKWWDVARLLGRDDPERQDELKRDTVVVAKKVFDPPKDKVSVRATWWGYEIYLPEVVFLKFGNDVEPVLTALTYLSTALAVVLTKAPPFVVALPGFPLLQSLVPVLSAIVSAVTWYWKTIKKMDLGEGIILSATWVLPVAVVPRPLRRKFDENAKREETKEDGSETAVESGATGDAEKENPSARERTRPRKLRRVLSRNKK